MSDDGSCRSVLGQLFDYVSGSNAWNVSQNKQSACPSKRKKLEEEDRARQRLAEGEGSESQSSEDKSKDSHDDKLPYTPPSKMCPTVKSCCYIKMQDPCAPCCCDTKPKLPPCPPKYGPQEPRRPICGCDLCQKNPDNDRCCDRNRGFRGISLDPRYFEKA
ncbi:PREDICTED: uncharacterized protein LOC107185498 [Dufourea novaeangliae]|uniref:uncharacterized protein LOC107185498 n=1 Tax=Dufourea novaeangliae TaxID=178035 RepID=UPI00076726C6|nr:PREDICTED: uncharacterized protein LOC107185498 [Dufourea novaeangliae]